MDYLNLASLPSISSRTISALMTTLHALIHLVSGPTPHAISHFHLSSTILALNTQTATTPFTYSLPSKKFTHSHNRLDRLPLSSHDPQLGLHPFHRRNLHARVRHQGTSPGYVAKALERFQHTPHSCAEHSPHAWYTPIYGTHPQITSPGDDTALLPQYALTRIQ
jgi:hypothetical protein